MRLCIMEYAFLELDRQDPLPSFFLLVSSTQTGYKHSQEYNYVPLLQLLTTIDPCLLLRKLSQ